jgi:hypothetical protein
LVWLIKANVSEKRDISIFMTEAGDRTRPKPWFLPTKAHGDLIQKHVIKVKVIFQVLRTLQVSIMSLNAADFSPLIQ